MYWIFGMKFIDLGDSCTMGGDPTMNIIIARVPVLNAPEDTHASYHLHMRVHNLLLFVV